MYVYTPSHLAQWRNFGVSILGLKYVIEAEWKERNFRLLDMCQKLLWPNAEHLTNYVCFPKKLIS